MGRVLIINDQDDLLEVCRLILEPQGFDVQTVAHAEQVPILSVVQAFAPDLILLDLVMPVASGQDVATWLKADPRGRAVPFVIMSALSDGANIARALGAQAFLKKPFSDDGLIEVVSRYTRAAPDSAHST